MKYLLIIFSLLAFITPAHAELVSLNCGPKVNILIDTEAGTYTYNFIAPKNYKYGSSSRTGRVVVSPSRYTFQDEAKPTKLDGVLNVTRKYVDRLTGKYHLWNGFHHLGENKYIPIADDSFQCYKGKAPKPKF